MSTLTRRVDGTLGFTIPADFAKEIGLNPNSEVLVRRMGASIVISVPRAPSALDELLSQVTPANMHGETDTGPSVGREAV